MQVGGRVIWSKKLTKGENLACIAKSAGIMILGFIAAGLILALTGAVNWAVFYFFFGVAGVTSLITLIAALVQKPAEYAATNTGIICKYQSATWQAYYSEIERVKLRKYLFLKGRGKIKFKVKSGFSLNYSFYMVDDVEKVYSLILSAMHPDGTVSNKM